MKKIILISVLIFTSCCNKTNQATPIQKDTIKTDVTTIAEIVDWANSLEWTEEEIRHLDSIQDKSDYPVGNAERNLDTIVNHIRIHFRNDVPGTMY